MRSALYPTLAVPLLLVGLSASVPLRASESPQVDPFATRLLGKDLSPQKTRACFVRVYDADHLAKHPKQKVAAMMLLVGGEIDGDSKAPNYSFSLGLKLRGKTARYESGGNCHHAQASETEAGDTAAGDLSCGVDCDGGGFGMALSTDNTSTLLTLDRGLSTWQAGKDDEDRGFLEPGADDKAFRLQRAALSDCVPIAEDKADADALRHGK